MIYMNPVQVSRFYEVDELKPIELKGLAYQAISPIHHKVKFFFTNFMSFHNTLILINTKLINVLK